MASHDELVNILKKYAPKIRTSFTFHVGNTIPEKALKGAIKNFAPNLDPKSIIGFYDTSITNSGKYGYIFTETKVYYREAFEKPKKLWYDDIKNVTLNNTRLQECDQSITIHLYDGTTVTWAETFLKKPALHAFLEELLKAINNENKTGSPNIQHHKENHAGAEAGGIAFGSFETVNKVYDEEKFHARQGHGFAAERANHLYDRMTGHDAQILGDDNAINGADRIVDGIYIQSKYCATGSRCVNECFTDNGKGTFRYMIDGKPMQIEVPSDKYDSAVQAMEEKIKRGQVEGITDPEEAKNIIRKGHFTYEQAKNIAKAGTVESLTYDTVNGIITASSAFGVTAIISFATSVWNGEDFDQAVKIATFSGLKVGGTAFVTSVLASQLSKAGLNSALVGSSEAIVSIMGPKASAMLINAFRSGSNIYGAAAMKSAAKLLRGNAITAGVTIVVMSSFDIANIFRHRISGKQLFKNIANTTSTVAGGTGGWLAGAAIGSAILPGAGTIIGGLLGSIGAGAAAGKVSGKITDSFIEDDAEAMVRIIEKVFTETAADYLMNQKEVEKATDKLAEKLSGKLLKDMFASSDRKEFAGNLILPIIENEVSKRPLVALPSNQQMIEGIRGILEAAAAEDDVDDNITSEAADTEDN